MDNWTSRLIDVPLVDPEELLANPLNPRRHPANQRDALRASLDELGWVAPVYVNMTTGHLIDGHARTEEALSKGIKGVPVLYLELSLEEEKKMISTFDPITNMADYDQEILSLLADDVVFEEPKLEELFDSLRDTDKEIPEGADDVPDVDDTPAVSRLGEIYLLGEHRVLCGDSTDRATVERLMDGKKADMVFTDPPYGMKKENKGVLNDNLNYDKLLEFNKAWISLTFDFMKEVGSWYCWGIDEPLMDIYSHILKPMAREQKLTFRNLITWDKGNGQGQKAEEFRSYAIADEKCLFVMCGVQGFNSNSDNYYEGWETIRVYLDGERKKLGWTDKTVADFFGFHPRMANHWFSKSQWSMPTKEQYQRLQSEANHQAFKRDYDDIKRDYDDIKREYETIKAEWMATRAYFDNTHDNMNNVWHFDRTSQEEREGTGEHATPKPLALCSRAIKSSSREGEIVLDVFLGSGSTLIACEQTKRKCYGLELDPKYVDVIRKRWVKFVYGTDDNWEHLTPAEGETDGK